MLRSKKARRKICMMIAALAAVSCLSFGPVTAKAPDREAVFVYGDHEIHVLVEDGMTADEAKAIADYIAFGEDAVSPASLPCYWGHTLTTSMVTEYVHNAYSASPKCVKNTYKVERCEVCVYLNKTLLRSERTSICHG